MWHPLPAARRRAFTLIEVLVVIGIVLILAGMMGPMLKAVRDAGRSTICQGRMGIIGMALGSYTVDSLKYLPLSNVNISLRWPSDSFTTAQAAWIQAYGDPRGATATPGVYTGATNAIVMFDPPMLGQYLECDSIFIPQNSRWNRAGAYYAMRSRNNVMRCPAQRYGYSPTSPNDSFGHTVVSYALNENFSDSSNQRSSTKDPWLRRRLDQIPNRATAMVMVDSASQRWQPRYTAASPENYGYDDDIAKWPFAHGDSRPTFGIRNWSNRHNRKGANCLFADGRVAYVADPTGDTKAGLVDVGTVINVTTLPWYGATPAF